MILQHLPFAIAAIAIAIFVFIFLIGTLIKLANRSKVKTKPTKVNKAFKSKDKTNPEILRWKESPITELENFVSICNEFGVDSEDLYLETITTHPDLLKQLKFVSPELRIAAAKSDGLSIRFMDNPSEELQLVAVRQNVYAIGYINDPTLAVQKFVMQKNPVLVSKHLNKFSPEAIRSVVASGVPVAWAFLTEEQLRAGLATKITKDIIE